MRTQLWPCQLGRFVWKLGQYYNCIKRLQVFHKRRICFQELHIIKQYVRYETKNKLLLDFWRKYMIFKSKQWLSVRVKMSSLFSWILLLKNATKIVGGKFWMNYVYDQYWLSSLEETTIIHKIFETTLVFVSNSALQ